MDPLRSLPTCALVALGLAAAACAPSAAPVREDITPPLEPSTPPTPAWLQVETGFADSEATRRVLSEVSGYARLVFAGATPDWGDPRALILVGPINPSIRLGDVDGDGRADPGGDMIIGAEGPSREILVWGGDANAGRTVRVGVVLYDHLGGVIGTGWNDGDVLLEPRAEPLVVKFGPVLTPSGPTPCYDGLDNDGDGWADAADDDCQGGVLLERGRGVNTCNDGDDNDGDGQIDATDPDCSDGGDLSELPSCADGLDDDGDTWADGDDPDCASLGNEQGTAGNAPCNDGQDNDLDSFVDGLDPQCASALGSE